MTEINRPEEDLALDVPEADAAEQRLPADAEHGAASGQEWPDEVPFDADEADVAEQKSVVELDDDDYR